MLEAIERSPELLKQSGMTKQQLANARAAIKHQLAEMHSQGFGDVPLHLAGLKELIPGVLWSGTRRTGSESSSDSHLRRGSRELSEGARQGSGLTSDSCPSNY